MITSLSQAHSAYAQSLQNSLQTSVTDDVPDGTSGNDFGSVMSQAVKNVIATGHDAEAQSAVGLNGGGDMTQIVTAVSNAQLALQTSTVIRDRMVQAYQDVMKMTI
ncbi:flagellar hook-basal body complex protein FliE [Gluconobacter japonicus]|uniref:flagellar hook-basal body complex protein FliE n=1 Tax=Gluconobacter japonicus TaxID=376620 RepID=UPI0024AD03BD|nr:flagellar hook-basal body complex protein FliE [Gluconobacter japonicus]MDI6651396.1 flagellar hook-basal body complex protein FliE [Gluconobacter japonicus]